MEALAENMKQLVDNSDKRQVEIMTQIREDRAITDKRLRWLEENIWKGGKGRHAI